MGSLPASRLASVANHPDLRVASRARSDRLPLPPHADPRPLPQRLAVFHEPHRARRARARPRSERRSIRSTSRSWSRGGRPALYLSRRRRSPRADIVIPRIGASITNYGLAVVRQFDMMGVPVLNTAVAIARSRDKLRALQLLTRAQHRRAHHGVRALAGRSRRRARAGRAAARPS